MGVKKTKPVTNTDMFMLTITKYYLSWLPSMNGPHRVHHVNTKTRRIAGSQYKFNIKILLFHFL